MSMIPPSQFNLQSKHETSPGVVQRFPVGFSDILLHFSDIVFLLESGFQGVSALLEPIDDVDRSRFSPTGLIRRADLLVAVERSALGEDVPPAWRNPRWGSFWIL